jgi:O-antigen ligase
MGVAAVLLATPFMPASFWARMASIVDEHQDKFHYTGSREERRMVMEEGIKTFIERPLTGVGAGQFQNYNPSDRKVRWHEAHNALIQVAADTGIFGLLAFSFLIFRAGYAAAVTRRMLRRPRKRDPDPLAAVMSDEDRSTLYDHTVGTTAALIGWFTCAMFASVAYSWTFYYLLALIVAARELARHRLAAAYALGVPGTKSTSVPPPARVSRLAPRMA